MVSYSVFCLPFIVLLFVQLGLSQNECTESKCGRGGPIVQFPFKIKDSKLDHWGYPGCDLSCTDEHETVLEQPAVPVKFYVKSIDYKYHVLEVYEPNNCFLRHLLGLNFSFSPFEFHPKLLNNYSIFDCSSSEGNTDYKEYCCHIIDNCFQLCAVLSHYDVSSFESPSCTKMGDISLISASWKLWPNRLFLSWTNPNCSICEAEGKNCKLKSNGTEGEIECFRVPKPIRGNSFAIELHKKIQGTVGYIAPEVFSRNFGKVSYKSDVYSFVILLLEMVGGKKNVEVKLENDTQIYYPEWIYNLLEGGEDLRIHIEEEKDSEIAKTLAIVGLWFIQWLPVDRPSMKIVVQMLEGDENKLSMPPNPFASTGPMITTASISPRCGDQGLEVIQEVE
ncbi:Receptor-like protein kinase [Quillaja saponaria]|uniref:Receptor-like protein kinase n=1 Tax=Quillaja saponaria TaxID=32244 RepID=A0AAD7KNV1_QUISA|nr:Receptor-like protein kinase [Quillaja saponaria]KAJ7942801.1 Receptor-like protein kinase [Quillaja saponaria]